jgi:hypothetical protein
MAQKLRTKNNQDREIKNYFAIYQNSSGDMAYVYMTAEKEAVSSAKLSISMEIECVGVVLAPEINVQKNLHDDGIASDAIWIGIKFSF